MQEIPKGQQWSVAGHPVKALDLSNPRKVRVVLKDGRRLVGTHIPNSRGMWNFKEESK